MPLLYSLMLVNQSDHINLTPPFSQ